MSDLESHIRESSRSYTSYINKVIKKYIHTPLHAVHHKYTKLSPRRRCERTQTPHYNKQHQQISPRCLTHYTTGHRGQLNTYYHQTTYPQSPQLTYDMTTDYNKTDGLSPTTRKLTGHNSLKTCFRSDHHTLQHTHCQHNFTYIILMADNHNIPKGKMHGNCRLLPDHIVCKITQRHKDPALKFLNEEITSDIEKHKQNLKNEHLDAHWDHRHNTQILWKTTTFTVYNPLPCIIRTLFYSSNLRETHYLVYNPQTFFTTTGDCIGAVRAWPDANMLQH